ncbi:MAG: flagellar export chaperone FliS [Chromatiales bacterium]|nr:flagellar export chaperone FliS [Chromatiales bacterium]
MNPNSAGQALGQYRAVDAWGTVSAADRTQLILRMMQGALDRIHVARGHLQRGEIARKGEQIARAAALVDTLRASLNHEQGGELADRLAALYDYMARRLTEANLRNDPAILLEVAGLLAELRDGWKAIVQQPAAQATQQPRDQDS